MSVVVKRHLDLEPDNKAGCLAQKLDHFIHPECHPEYSGSSGNTQLLSTALARLFGKMEKRSNAKSKLSNAQQSQQSFDENVDPNIATANQREVRLLREKVTVLKQEIANKEKDHQAKLSEKDDEIQKLWKQLANEKVKNHRLLEKLDRVEHLYNKHLN